MKTVLSIALAVIASVAITLTASSAFAVDSGDWKLTLEESTSNSALYDVTLQWHFPGLKYVERKNENGDWVDCDQLCFEELMHLYFHGIGPSAEITPIYSYNKSSGWLTMKFSVRTWEVKADTKFIVDYSTPGKYIYGYETCTILVDRETNPLCTGDGPTFSPITQETPWKIHGAFEKDGYNHIIIIGYVDGIDREDEINAYILKSTETEETVINGETVHSPVHAWERIGLNDEGETQSYLLNTHDFIAVLKIKGLTESTIIKFTYQYAADTIDYADGEINESPYLFVCGNKFSAGLDACNPFTDDTDDITIHAEENGYRITAKLTSTRAAPPKEDVEAGKVRLIDASDGGVVAVDDIWISLGGGGPKLHIVIDDIDDIAGHDLYIKYGSAKTPTFTVGEGAQQDPDPDPDPNPTYIDDDNDGIDDAIDNCLGVANTDQDNWNDSDDNEGDACDNSDGDSYLDDVDNCPEDDNEDQINSDGDIKGDECDNDDDNDGIPDADDECPLDDTDTCNLSGGGGGTIIEQIADLIEEVDDGITMLPGGSSSNGSNGNDNGDGDGNSVVTASCSLTPSATGSNASNACGAIMWLLGLMSTPALIIRKRITRG